MIVLLISLLLDIAMLALIIIKTKSISPPFRFAAFSVILNLFAYYIASGLSESFGSNILFYAICAAVSKLFIIYIFGVFGQNKKTQNPFAYLTAIAVSVCVCVYIPPLPGIICGLILLVYLFYTEFSDKDEIKPGLPDTANENSLYIRTIEENYRKSRELWHDLNNHILSMRSLAENKKYDELEVYINSLSDKIAENAFPVKSGNIILDALIADKYHRAVKAGIYTEFELIDYRNTMEAEDLCVIAGNLFDNAIEENLRSPDKENRYIKVYISSIEDSLVIRFKNPLYHELTVKSGLPSTTKPDAVHHGMGLKNARRVCDKYGGDLLWTSENGVFEIAARLIIT